MSETAWPWRPLGVADLLDSTFKVLRARFGLFFAINAIITVPLAIVQNILLPQPPMSLLDQLATAGPDEADFLFQQFMLSFNWAQFFLLQMLVVVVTLFAGSLQTSATMWTANAYLHGSRPDLGAAFRGGLKHLWRVLGVRVLMIVMFAVAMFVLTFFAVFVGLLGGDWLALLLYLGGLVCFALFVVLRWLLAIPASIGEDADFGQAVTRSYELSKGAIGALLGRCLLFLLLYFVLSFIPITAIGTALELAAWASYEVQLAISGLLGALIGAVVQPLMPIMLMLLYYDRRVRREGYDLQQQAAQLGRDT